MNDRPDELALTGDEWILRRMAEVSLRSSRRVFVRARNAPSEKMYRDEWDKLFNEFLTAPVQGRASL